MYFCIFFSWGNNIVNTVTPRGTYWQYCYPWSLTALRNFFVSSIKKNSRSDQDSNQGPLEHKPKALTTTLSKLLLNWQLFFSYLYTSDFFVRLWQYTVIHFVKHHPKTSFIWRNIRSRLHQMSLNSFLDYFSIFDHFLIRMVKFEQKHSKIV